MWSTKRLCREIVLEMISKMVSPGRLCLDMLMETLGSLEEFRRKALVSSILEEEVMPLDGKFDDNVVLQIKSGPYDFQVREPLHPLLGGLHNSNVMMEVSANQGYTGHQIHVVNFAQAGNLEMKLARKTNTDLEKRPWMIYA